MAKMKVRDESGSFVDIPFANGASGTNGVDGKSPYEAAVEEGYTGTSQQLYTDLADLGNAEIVLSEM